MSQQIQDTTFPVIPVFLPDAPQEPELPHFLSINLAVDFRGKRLDDVDALRRLECGIRGKAPGPRRPNKGGNSNLEPIEFANRLDEIRQLTNTYCPPYLLLSAPMGYGKTRLIEVVANELHKEGWLCLQITLSREQAYTFQDIAVQLIKQFPTEQIGEKEVATAEKAAETVGRRILKTLNHSQRQLMIFVDETESLCEVVIKEFFKLFVRELQKILRFSQVTLRVIWSGRFISHWERVVDTPLKSFPLTPFDFSAVQETVNKCNAKHHFRLTEECQREFASHLMYFTGGHPKCMAQILCKDFGSPIDSKENEYYQDVVEPVIAEIKAHIPAELGETFEKLSVVRRFNGHLLNQLIQSGVLPWSQGDGYVLEDRLKDAYLVSAREDGFSSDDITRRLFAIHLRHTNFPCYQEMCQQAIAFYKAELQDPTSPNPAVLSVELLFQKLQSLAGQQQNDPKLFFEYVTQIFALWKSARIRHVRQIAAAFEKQLDNDWELRFILNYLLRAEIYDHDHPFQEFMEILSHFQQSL